MISDPSFSYGSDMILVTLGRLEVVINPPMEVDGSDVRAEEDDHVDPPDLQPVIGGSGLGARGHGFYPDVV